MSTLHTVNKSPFEKRSLESCLGYAQAGSSVLLYEDAVYGAIKGTGIADKMSNAAGVKFFVMGPDLKAEAFPMTNCWMASRSSTMPVSLNWRRKTTGFRPGSEP
jgi:sulfur relay protein TusB/DsrH